MSIVGRGCGCVKAPQVNEMTLTFWGVRRLLRSLIESRAVEWLHLFGTQISRDSGNLSEELAAPTIAGKYDFICPARSCGQDLG